MKNMKKNQYFNNYTQNFYIMVSKNRNKTF